MNPDKVKEFSRSWSYQDTIRLRAATRVKWLVSLRRGRSGRRN